MQPDNKLFFLKGRIGKIYYRVVLSKIFSILQGFFWLKMVVLVFFLSMIGLKAPVFANIIDQVDVTQDSQTRIEYLNEEDDLITVPEQSVTDLDDKQNRGGAIRIVEAEKFNIIEIKDNQNQSTFKGRVRGILYNIKQDVKSSLEWVVDLPQKVVKSVKSVASLVVAQTKRLSNWTQKQLSSISIQITKLSVRTRKNIALVSQNINHNVKKGIRFIRDVGQTIINHAYGLLAYVTAFVVGSLTTVLTALVAIMSFAGLTLTTPVILGLGLVGGVVAVVIYKFSDKFKVLVNSTLDLVFHGQCVLHAGFVSLFSQEKMLKIYEKNKQKIKAVFNRDIGNIKEDISNGFKLLKKSVSIIILPVALSSSISVATFVVKNPIFIKQGSTVVINQTLAPIFSQAINQTVTECEIELCQTERDYAITFLFNLAGGVNDFNADETTRRVVNNALGDNVEVSAKELAEESSEELSNLLLDATSLKTIDKTKDLNQQLDIYDRARVMKNNGDLSEVMRIDQEVLLQDTHVLSGEINKYNKAVGFHSQGALDYQGKSRIVEITKPVNKQGVYKAVVEIYDEKSQKWIRKKVQSSFFPDTWTSQKIIKEIKYAYSNREMMGETKWKGKTSNNIVLEGYMEDNIITSVYPKYE